MEKADLPPPYEPNASLADSAPPPPMQGSFPTQQPQYPPQQASSQQGGNPPTSQPGGYPPTSQPGSYPPTSQPGGYPPTSQPGGYPPTSQPGGYPPTSQPAGYPPTSQPGYNYPSHQQPGYQPQQGYALPPKQDYPPHSGYAPHPGYAPPAMSSSQQTSNTTVIMTGQPMAQPQQTFHVVPSNYMALSWLVCLFCCWPLGIAAIMASSGVDNAVAAGNYPLAHQQSRRARTLAITSIFCGIVIYVILVIRFTVLATTYSSSSYYN